MKEEMAVEYVLLIMTMSAALISSQDSSVAERCAQLEGSSERLDDKSKYGAPAVKLVRNSLNFTTMGIQWSLRESDAINVCSFTVHVWKADQIKNALLAKNTHNASTRSWLIENLQPGTTYEVVVETLYASQHAPVSWTLRSTTLGYGPDYQCKCNLAGTKPGRMSRCDPMSGECECKDKNTIGQNCDSCLVGFYMHEPYGCAACDQCPPAVYGSNGSCVYDKETVMQCICMEGYTGKHCDHCHVDYLTEYIEQYDTILTQNVQYTKCTKCDCTTNTNKTDIYNCFEKTGNCQSCLFITTGPVCEYCLSKYKANSLNETCLNMIGMSTHSSVVVIVFTVIILLCVLCVVFVIYRKYLLHRKARNFVHTHLKSEHDHVKFSAMMEEPDDTMPSYKI